jgi:hypothetical protein
MDYCYYLSYDEKKDEFWGCVSFAYGEEDSVFEINSTKDLLELLRTGKMIHIDDTKGLESFLKEEEYLLHNDCIKNVRVLY